MGNPTAADPEMEIARQMGELRKALPELTDAQAMRRVLKAHPELYTAATSTAGELVAGEGTLTELVNEQFSIELQKRLADGAHVSVATRDIARGRPELAELAELVQLYPADAAHPIDKAIAKLKKHRGDVVRLVKAAHVIDPDAIVAVAKRRTRP